MCIEAWHAFSIGVSGGSGKMWTITWVSGQDRGGRRGWYDGVVTASGEEPPIDFGGVCSGGAAQVGEVRSAFGP